MDIPESATCKYLLSFVTADTHILVENISPLAAVYTVEYNRENCKEQVILPGFTSAFSWSLCRPPSPPPFREERVNEGEKERMIFLVQREREREIYKSYQINRRADKLGRVVRVLSTPVTTRKRITRLKLAGYSVFSLSAFPSFSSLLFWNEVAVEFVRMAIFKIIGVQD